MMSLSKIMIISISGKKNFHQTVIYSKGFVISNIFDVTDDQSISNIKSNLIGEDKRNEDGFMEGFQEIFRSLLGLKDIRVGFSIYNKDEETFERVYGKGMESFLLPENTSMNCNRTLCSRSYQTLLKDKKFYSVADVDKYYELSKGKVPQYKALKSQGIKSAILAPIASDNELLGILELVSDKPKVIE